MTTTSTIISIMEVTTKQNTITIKNTFIKMQKVVIRSIFNFTRENKMERSNMSIFE